MRKSGIALAFELVVLFAAALAVVLYFIPKDAGASRNSAGSYSLPAGNPVVSGTTISSSWANTTMSDIKTELTDSLNRSGKGAMLAPLRVTNGTVAAPSVTFDSDRDTGLYRPDAGDVGVSADGVLVAQFHGGGALFPVGAAFSAGGVATQSTTNGDGFTATGNGTGSGLKGTGGSATGAGVYGVGGAPNGVGFEGIGTGNGAGGSFSGGTTGYGLIGLGATGKAGGRFLTGSSATSGTRQDAIQAANGDIDMSGVADPSSTTAVTDRITPVSFVKAWAFITISGSGTQTVSAGLNIASIACASSSIQVTLASGFSSLNYAVTVGSGGTREVRYSRSSATRIDFQFFNAAGSVVDPCGVFTDEFSFAAYGAQ